MAHFLCFMCCLESEESNCDGKLPALVFFESYGWLREKQGEKFEKPDEEQ